MCCDRQCRLPWGANANPTTGRRGHWPCDARARDRLDRFFVADCDPNHGLAGWPDESSLSCVPYGLGLIKNPMIVAISLGLLWSGLKIPIPAPMNEFLALLGAAATPGALFAIGASLASKSAERLSVAGWLSFCKLVVHPLFVAFACFVLFKVDPYKATVVISAAALPVAGNVYILAQHYGVAPQRVSAAILVSTALSIVTVSVWIAWLTGS